MAKEQLVFSDTKWTKDAAARTIIDCQKELLEMQSRYFSLLGTLQEGKYKRAIDVTKRMIAEIKNQNLVLQALLLEFDGGIPVEEDGVKEALDKLRKALEDTDEE